MEETEEKWLKEIKQEGCTINKEEKRFFIPDGKEASPSMLLLIQLGWKGQYEIR